MVCLIPGNRLLQSFAEARLCLEAEFIPGPGRVQHAARLAVGLGGIPSCLAREAGQLHDQFRQVADGYFKAGADIDRFALVVGFHGQDDGLGRIFHVEKLPGCRACPPGDNFFVALPFGIHAFLDEGGGARP